MYSYHPIQGEHSLIFGDGSNNDEDINEIVFQGQLVSSQVSSKGAQENMFEEDDLNQDIDSMDENNDTPTNLARWEIIESVSYLMKVKRISQSKQIGGRRRTSVLMNSESYDQGEEETSAPEESFEDSLNSQEEKRRKSANPLSHHPAVVKAIQNIWEVDDIRSTLDSNMELGKDDYVKLLVKFQYLIVPPPVKLSVAIANARVDWTNDTKVDGTSVARMNQQLFHTAMFQLADTWSIESDAAEYVTVLEKLLRGVTERKLPDLNDLKLRLIGNNKNIVFDPFFGGQANKKFKGLRTMFGTKVKKQKGADMSLSAAHSNIARLYQAKMDHDRKMADKSSALVPFDKFIHDEYLRHHGSEITAKRNLKRLIIATQCHCFKRDAKMLTFATLCGIDLPPSIFASPFDHYDPHLASDYIFRIFNTIFKDAKSLNPVFRKKHCYAMSHSFVSATMDACRHVPLSSKVFHDFRSIIDEISLNIEQVDDPSCNLHGDTPQSPKPTSPKHPNPSPKHLDFKKRKGVVRRRLTNVLNNMGLQLSNIACVDIHQALLFVYPLLEIDRKWGIISRYCMYGYVIRKWMRKTFKNEARIPKLVHTFANVRRQGKRVIRNDMVSATFATIAVKSLESLTGVSLLHIEEDEDDEDLHLLFVPSLSTPRRLLEDARKQDQVINTARSLAEQALKELTVLEE